MDDGIRDLVENLPVPRHESVVNVTKAALWAGDKAQL